MQSTIFNTKMLLLVVASALVTSVSCTGATQGPDQESGFETITFASADGLTVTADVYQKGNDSERPMIVLCHQAGWSRGEYREIAPRLNEMGFNCMAIDQRSGGAVNNVTNLTAQAAKLAGKPTEYTDAEQDIIAAVNHVRSEKMATGKVILWGSSYSSALVLRVTGENADLVDAVLSFAPGEYFTNLGKPKDWIAQSARNIKVPTFITSAKGEAGNWAAIFEAIPGDNKVKFLPETDGNHGSRALWKKFNDSGAYWEAVTPFLKNVME